MFHRVSSRTLRPLPAFALMMVAAAVMHYLVLRYVFPGYYRPLTPQHTDFYSYIAAANTSFRELVFRPRPVAWIIARLQGSLGLQGSLAASHVVIFANCALIGAVAWLAAPPRYKLVFGAAYLVFLYLVFAHPYFYTMAVWDGSASPALFFLLLGVVGYRLAGAQHRRIGITWFVTAVLLSFLCKETYVLSAAVLAFVVAVSRRDRLLLVAGALGAFAATIALSRLVSSPFLSFAGDLSDAYRVDLSPSSIMRIMSGYAERGYSWPLVGIGCVVLGVTAWVATRSKRRDVALLVVGFPLAGILSLVPNAVLPNHVFWGYSWGGALLIFAPIVLLSSIMLPRELVRTMPRLAMVLAMLGILVAGSRLFFVYGEDSRWVLTQEAIQANLINSLDYFAQQPGLNFGARRVLVAGITFPFSPFSKHPSTPPAMDRSLIPWVPNRDVSFDIINSTEWEFGDGEVTRWIRETPKDLSFYDQVWIFRPDGTAVLSASPDDPAELAIIVKHLPAG